MPDILESVALRYLKYRKRRMLRKQGVADPAKPLRLLAEYNRVFKERPEHLQQLAADVVAREAGEVRMSTVQSTEYHTFKQDVDRQLSAFENRPYQLGALDAEIDLVVTLLCQYDNPDVLEVGVANGYSSAFLFFAIDKIGGRITSVDLPRFGDSKGKLYAIRNFPHLQMREWLAAKGKITNTGTLGDLNPGGVIPPNRYAGWLVPMPLRRSVPHTMICGDVFNVLADMEGATFDFAVFDAMKGYNERFEALRMIEERMRPNGLCVVDGYWVNGAFEDFCRQSGYPAWCAGRVGVFAKRRAEQGSGAFPRHPNQCV